MKYPHLDVQLLQAWEASHQVDEHTNCKSRDVDSQIFYAAQHRNGAISTQFLHQTQNTTLGHASLQVQKI
jgi:hypothetical protein